ncbi:hypothetical protein M2990_00005 [Klebsiella pneumoniae]|nr:hypothetical protein [Klebsiella pneumoniae]MCL0818764.1 hypothetical protein [Klebsiella pneumoniae]
MQKALAELEGGYRSLLVPTGLAACTSTTMTKAATEIALLLFS